MRSHPFLLVLCLLVLSGCGGLSNTSKPPLVSKKIAFAPELTDFLAKEKKCNPSVSDANYISVRLARTNISPLEPKIWKTFFQKTNTSILIYAKFNVQTNERDQQNPSGNPFELPILLVEWDQTSNKFKESFVPGLIFPNTALNTNRSLAISFHCVEGFTTSPGELQELITLTQQVAGSMNLGLSAALDTLATISSKTQDFVSKQANKSFDITSAFEIRDNNICKYNDLLVITQNDTKGVSYDKGGNLTITQNAAYVLLALETKQSLFGSTMASIMGSSTWNTLASDLATLKNLKANAGQIAALTYLDQTIAPKVYQYWLTPEDQTTLLLALASVGGISRATLSHANISWYNDQTLSVARKHGVNFDASLQEKAVTFANGWSSNSIESSLMTSPATLTVSGDGIPPIPNMPLDDFTKRFYLKYNDALSNADVDFTDNKQARFTGLVCDKPSEKSTCLDADFKAMRILLHYNDNMLFDKIHFVTKSDKLPK